MSGERQSGETAWRWAGNMNWEENRGVLVPNAAAGGGPPPRDETLKALRRPMRAAGGKMRRMGVMIQGCCRFESSLSKFVECPQSGGSALA